MRARNFLQHKWHAITIILTVIAIACAALVILRGMPPHRLIMATGLEGGSYYEVGQRYRASLARESVQVELRLTSGSAENLALLLDPDSGVSVAVVPSGIAPAGSVSELSALGTIFNEPLWWFQRRDVEGVGLESLRGRKISIGPEGSGTRVVALEWALECQEPPYAMQQTCSLLDHLVGGHLHDQRHPERPGSNCD